MEITIINSLKKSKTKSKSKSEESSAILENGSQIKLKDIDINKTVKEFKDHIRNNGCIQKGFKGNSNIFIR